MRIPSICFFMTALAVSIQAAPLPPSMEFDLLKTEKGRETAERSLTVWREDGGGTTAEAAYCIGICFYNGIDVEIDKKMAFGFFRKSAVEGYADAEFTVGLFYLNGEKDVVKTNTTAAAQWFAKAAEQEHPKAQLYLGVCYRKGIGVKQDDELGVRWIRKAAEQGIPKAQFYVGTYYADGIVYDKNPAEAIIWFKLAAEQGYAEAQHNLGCCYATGEGTEKNLSEAVRWYQKSADQGYAGAQHNLGCCFANGQGVQKDIVQAVLWYKKAGEQGLVQAHINLGNCYGRGTGVVQNDVQACVHYLIANALSGTDQAQNNLRIIRDRLSAAQYAAAQQAVTEWVEKFRAGAR